MLRNACVIAVIAMLTGPVFAADPIKTATAAMALAKAGPIQVVGAKGCGCGCTDPDCKGGDPCHCLDVSKHDAEKCKCDCSTCDPENCRCSYPGECQELTWIAGEPGDDGYYLCSQTKVWGALYPSGNFLYRSKDGSWASLPSQPPITRPAPTWERGRPVYKKMPAVFGGFVTTGCST